MRKLAIISIVCLLLLLLGCTNESEEASETVETTEEHTAEEVVQNRDRTVYFFDKSPFEVDLIILNKWIKDGERVFLLEDGEYLENKLLETINYYSEEAEKLIKRNEQDYKEGRITEGQYKSIVEMFDEPPNLNTDELYVFAKDIEKHYPEAEEYINALFDAYDLTGEEKYDEAKQKLEEARQIRERLSAN